MSGRMKGTMEQAEREQLIAAGQQLKDALSAKEDEVGDTHCWCQVSMRNACSLFEPVYIFTLTSLGSTLDALAQCNQTVCLISLTR